MLTEEFLVKYHDAEIVRVQCSDLEKGLEVGLKLEKGIEQSILFGKCQFYRIDGMWRQNVVYRIRTSLSESMSSTDVHSILRNMVRNDNNKSSLPKAQIELWARSIVEGRLVLSVIEPSTGAEITILSQSLAEIVVPVK